MKHHAKTKETSFNTVPKERPRVENPPLPSKKWRKMYDCKRTKGQHAWTDMRIETVGYQLMKPNSPHGWHVNVYVKGKRDDAIFARWGFWYTSISVEEYLTKGLPKDAVGHVFQRGRIITCTACGHHEWELERSQDDGITWEEEEHTAKQRRKHGTA